jgi:hypothetical protein
VKLGLGQALVSRQAPATSGGVDVEFELIGEALGHLPQGDLGPADVGEV